MRVSDAVGTFAIVFILPEDVNITSGSPRSHRNFLDIYISQLSQTYLRSLIEYQKALKQRNALLKKIKEKSAGLSQLDAWDEGVVKWALEVMRARNDFIDEIGPKTKSVSAKLSGTRDDIAVAYKPKLRISDYADIESALKVFHEGRNRDIRIGASLIGPHRDGLDISINGHSLRQFGSLGQKKTVMIAMKLATLETLSAHRKEQAILIMDEAFAELDRTRGRALLSLLSDGGQVFLASATMSGLEKETMTVFKVSHDSVLRAEA